jgi:hypothetical protein
MRSDAEWRRIDGKIILTQCAIAMMTVEAGGNPEILL